MQVRAVSVVGDVDIVAPDFEVLAVERLANVSDKLAGEVSVSPNTQAYILGSVAHVDNHLVPVSVDLRPSRVAQACMGCTNLCCNLSLGLAQTCVKQNAGLS